MSPTRLSFFKAFLGAGAVAMLPESAFAMRQLVLPPGIGDNNPEFNRLINAPCAFFAAYISNDDAERLIERVRDPKFQAGLRESVEWLKVAIQIAEEELR